MSDTAILDFLRTRFTRVDEALADIKTDIGELRARVGRIERAIADVQVQLAEHSIRMDRMGADIDRMKRRLDLVDAT